VVMRRFQAEISREKLVTNLTNMADLLQGWPPK
jgi:hypothetical protein